MFNNNLLMGAAAAAASGTSLVSVGNSALFVEGNNENLSRTPSGAGNRDTWTFSTWVYRTLANTEEIIFNAGADDNNRTTLKFNANNIQYFHFDSGGVTDVVTTSAVYRDTGWYHVVLAVDTTQAIESNRVIIYVNGERVTALSASNYPAQNTDTDVNSTVAHVIGCDISGSNDLDAYLAETVLIDGTQLAPTSFGAYDSSGLYWTPLSSTTIKALTFGTNGFYLDNTTNAQTDASGEGNNWTNNNTVTTTTHSPTNISALLSPLDKASSLTLSNGNRTFVAGTNQLVHGTIPLPDSGKYYWEVNLDTASSASVGVFLALNGGNEAMTTAASSWGTAVGLYRSNNGNIYVDTTSIFTLSGVSPINTTWQIAVDLDNDKMWFGIDNTWMSSTAATGGNPSTGANPVLTRDFTGYRPLFGNYSNTMTVDFNSASWGYTAPTGFVELNTTNIAAATTRTASDTTKYFDTILYEGSGVSQRVGQFQPFGNAFTVANSSLFDDANSESLTKALSTPSSANVWTFSTWLKRGAADSTGVVVVFGGTYNRDLLLWNGGDNLHTLQNGTTGIDFGQTLEDTSQWFHVVWSQNGTTAIGYINGVQVVTGTATNDTINESGITHYIGNRATSAAPYDGYLAETVFIDGSALTPSSFGQTDTSTNRWIPKDVSGLTFGNNGFYLNYANSSDVGNDVSGNNNDWTNNNTVLQSNDSPTSNFAILAPEFCYATPSAGNLVADGYAPASSNTTGLGVETGKWYWEVTMGSTVGYPVLGIVPEDEIDKAQAPYNGANSFGWYDTQIYRAGSPIYASYATGPANNQVNAVMLDLDSNPQTLTFRRANTQLATIPIPPNKVWHPSFRNGDTADASNITLNFGASDFTYTPPTGFVGLSQDNIASSDQFISAFSWIKNRDATDNHMLFDRVRGINKDLHSNDTSAQVTNVETVQSFLAGGVQVGNDVEVNTASESYVLWNWMIEATGSGSANTAGSVNTTSTLVDTTLGLSISQFECPNDSNDFTIGHGLGAIPKVVILKSLDDGSYNWSVFHASTMDNQDYLKLNSNAAQTDYGANIWGAAVPTSTVIGITANVAVLKNTTCMCYAFADSQFIATGKYTGNGNVNGTFVPTVNSLGVPIQPIFLLYKDIGNANSWCIADTKRSPFNVGDDVLFPDATDVEQTNSINNLDIVTGGLKFRTTYNRSNGSSYNYIYMAIGTPIIDTDGRIIAGR